MSKDKKRKRPFLDPVLFDHERPRVPGKKLALGLDFGTNCGIALRYFDHREMVSFDDTVYSGIWNLSVGPWETGPLRIVRLRQFLAVTNPDVIFFEDVKFTPSKELMGLGRVSIPAVLTRCATSIELLGNFKGATTSWAEENHLPAAAFGIGEIKKHATGRGNANKVAMIEACNEIYGTDFDPETYQTTGADNEVDAIFVLDLGLARYAEGLR